MSYCVYRHTAPNGKVYIGVTSQKPHKRWDYGHGYRSNKHFWNAIQKYGWSNMKHDVLFEGLSRREAACVEIELIALYRSYDRRFGYNIALGGSLNTCSEETRIKLSNSHKGKELSEEQRRKISEAVSGEKHPFFGKHHTLETRTRLSEAQKGNKPWCTGLKLTDEHRAKISAAHVGLKPTAETIDKWRKSNEYRMTSVEQISVLTGSVIARFPSTKDAFRHTGVDSSSIAKCCRGERKTAGGFVWRHTKEKTEYTERQKQNAI